jgi:hypothetical protein
MKKDFFQTNVQVNGNCAGIFKQSMGARKRPEPVFLNIYGAQELIPRNEFRQPM